MKHKILLTVTLALAITAASLAADGGRACALVTPAEIEALVGTRLELKGVTVGTSDFCSARTPQLGVMVRLAQRAAGAVDKESAAVTIARKMGSQVDIKKFGPMTCSAIVPTPDKEVYGFTTTCSFVRGTTVAVLEVTTQKRESRVSIDKLHELAEKMAKRF